MKYIVLAFALFATPALACDKLAPNCTPANVSIDNAQKGPVQPDPLARTNSNYESLVRARSNG